MLAVWLRVRAGLRQDWRGLAVLALVTALMGSVVLVALAGAHRTATAVSRFVQYAGPTEAQVAADSRTMDKIAALPSVAYTMRAAFMLAVPVTADGRMAAAPGQVITMALVHSPPQARAIVIAGRPAVSSRASEVMINEAAARVLNARVGSVIHLRGYRPDQFQPVIDGAVLRPRVPLPAVRVVGIIRTPADLGARLDVPADVSYVGDGTVLVTAAFYHRFAAKVGSLEGGLAVHLKRGEAGLAPFESEVKRLAGNRAQIQAGSDDSTVAASVQRGTSVQALALTLFGVIVAMAMLVIVGQSIARQAHTRSDDFPVLRALGASPGQLFAVAFAPGTLVAAGGMLLAIPAAYGLSALTPIGLARQAEVSPGLSFDAAVLLGAAAAVALLLTGRAAITAWRVTRTGTGMPAAAAPSLASRAGQWMAHAGFPPTAVSGVRLAFEPGRDRTAVPVRSAIFGTTAALAAVMAAVVFGSSLAHVMADPAVVGWTWDLAVGNPHSGDISAQTEQKLRNNPDVAGFTATAMAEAQLDGHHVTVVGMQSVRGAVAPPVLAGRLPDAPDEIALGGRDLRALHKRVGDQVTARTARGSVALHIVGQVVVPPDITNEQVQLGSGAVMTLPGAAALSSERLARNVFPVQLRRPADHAAIGRLKQQFPGAVLPAVPPPEIRNLQEVSGLPLALALLLTLLAAGTIAHTLVTSVRRRRRELAILKTVGFVARQVRATVAWQATAIAGLSLIIGLPLGIAAGRSAWILFATRIAIEPVPVISPLVLLALPAVIVLANAVASFPAQAAAHTQPATVLRAE
jgi:putative ABC transport system permease protein